MAGKFNGVTYFFVFVFNAIHLTCALLSIFKKANVFGTVAVTVKRKIGIYINVYVVEKNGEIRYYISNQNSNTRTRRTTLV